MVETARSGDWLRRRVTGHPDATASAADAEPFPAEQDDPIAALAAQGRHGDRASFPATIPLANRPSDVMLMFTHHFTACALALMLLSTSTSTATAAPGVPMSANTQAAQDADSLRHDIRSAYERLRDRGELAGTVRGLSIDGAVSPHIAPGMTLEAAEEVLRAAGFHVAPPAPEAESVYASSDTILPNTSIAVRNEVIVVLTPKGTGPQATVGAVDARIVVTTL